MNVLICDDDLKIVQQIKNFLLKLSKQSTYKFDITCFSNGDSILDKQIKTDFAFIDIEMPGVNGLSVTKHLQTLNPNIIVFIVTSFQGYLDDAMDLKVFRFLSKPIDENRFFKSMDVALNLYKQSTEKIILDYFDECHNIFTIDILYLTIENRKTKLVTKTQEFISNKKFDYWKNRLKSYGYFAQSHYSYIINLKTLIKTKSRYRLILKKQQYLYLVVFMHHSKKPFMNIWEAQYDFKYMLCCGFPN